MSVEEYPAHQPKQKSRCARQPSPASTSPTTDYTTVKTIDLENGDDYEERTKKRIQTKAALLVGGLLLLRGTIVLPA